MKDIWLRVRTWISGHAMPKEIRPFFVKALEMAVDDILKVLKEQEKTNQAEE